MDLELKIGNFGPINEATVQVGPFTVFAGPNNTGKTFVSKMLYSMLDTGNANHALVSFELSSNLITTTTSLIESNLQRHYGERGEHSLSAVRKGIEKINSILQAVHPSHPSQSELDALKAVQPALVAEIEEIKSHLHTLKNDIETKKAGGYSPYMLGLLAGIIYHLEKSFSDVKAEILPGWLYKFRQSVYENFQVPDFSTLKGDGDSPLYFSVQGVGELCEEADSQFIFMPSPQIVKNVQSFPEVFYLESPLYWKLKNPLELIKLDSRSPLGPSLNGVPAYFYDLAAALRRTHIDHPLTGIHNRLHDAIGGKIALSEAGDLEFQKNGKSIPLSLASAGVANMGMLALLIERGTLDRGSFLFIDEPESNLHSAWQVEMAAILFDLARQGVNVVVSTHSMTILKWLEVHVKEKPEDRALVKLNKFPPDAEWNDDMDAVMAEVKQSLTKPFSDLYIRGL